MSLKPLRETVRLYQAIKKSQSLEESLRSGSMTGFLILEDGAEAIKTLNDNINAASADIKTLGAAVPNSMPNTRNALKAAMSELVALRLKPDTKIAGMSILKDPVEEAGKVIANAAKLSSTIVAAANTIMGTVNDLELKDQDSPLEKALDAAREADPDAGIPDASAFLKGVEKAWQPPKGFGNFFKDLASKFGFGGGADFFGLEAKTFAQDLMATSAKDLLTFLSGAAAKDAVEVGNDEPLAQMDDQLAAAGMTPKVMAGKEGEGKEGKEGEAGKAAGETKKWSELSAAYLKAVEDQAVGKKVLDVLKADKDFAASVKDSINLEESMYRRSLSSLLFEEVKFNDVWMAITSGLGLEDDQEQSGKLAVQLVKTLKDQGITVDEVPNFKEESKEGEEVAGEKEAEQEVANADAELKAAVKDEAGESQSPAAAAMGAIDSWVGGLSVTSQKSLKAKNRVDGLKQAVSGSLDKIGKVVEKEVSKAIAGWRKEHEDTLMKSKRFAKKNFDALQQLIPQLAASMVKKANEAYVPLTKSTIHKSVHSFLDRKFFTDHDDILNEDLLAGRRQRSPEDETETEYTEDDMVRHRWLKMAGLGS